MNEQIQSKKKMRGMGRVYKPKYKRAGTVYECSTWWIGYYHRGKQYRESSESQSETQARKLLKQRLGEISRGKLIGPKAERLTFKQMAGDLLNDYIINNKRSLRSAMLSVNHLGKFFGAPFDDEEPRKADRSDRMTDIERIRTYIAQSDHSEKALDITTDRIRTYIAKRQEEIAARRLRLAAQKREQVRQLKIKVEEAKSNPKKAFYLLGETNWLEAEIKSLEKIGYASINRELSALKRMFSLAIQAEKLSSRPYIPMLEENNARQGFVDYDVFLPLSGSLGKYRDAMAFLYLSGWRSGEVKKAERRDVDRPAGIVRLRPELSKNKKGRVLPLAGELLEIVDRALADARLDCPLLFHINGRPLGDIRKSWKKACIENGLYGFVPHDFRRSAVRNLTRAGIRDKTVMDLTGHKTRDVFDRYNIVSEEDLALAGEQLWSYLQRRPRRAKVALLKAPGGLVREHA